MNTCCNYLEQAATDAGLELDVAKLAEALIVAKATIVHSSWL